MDKASGSQPRGCGFETNCSTNSLLLFFVTFTPKIYNISELESTFSLYLVA